MNVKLRISNVTHIQLEPTWREGDHLEYLTLTVVDSLNDEVELRLLPVEGAKMDLMFPDPPDNLDGLVKHGFEDVTGEDTDND